MNKINDLKRNFTDKYFQYINENKESAIEYFSLRKRKLRDFSITVNYLFTSKSYESVGRENGLTRERIRQITHKTVRILKYWYEKETGKDAWTPEFRKYLDGFK